MNPANENYIEKAKSDNVILEDLESATAAPGDRPALGSGILTALTGGDDGLTGLSDADYIGVQARRTGMYVFDEVDDALQLATPGVSSPAVIAAGVAY